MLIFQSTIQIPPLPKEQGKQEEKVSQDAISTHLWDVVPHKVLDQKKIKNAVGKYCTDAIAEEILLTTEPRNLNKKIKEIRNALDTVANAHQITNTFPADALSVPEIANLFVQYTDAMIDVAKAKRGVFASNTYLSLKNLKEEFVKHQDIFIRMIKAEGGSNNLFCSMLLNVPEILKMFNEDPMFFAQMARNPNEASNILLSINGVSCTIFISDPKNFTNMFSKIHYRYEREYLLSILEKKYDEMPEKSFMKWWRTSLVPLIDKKRPNYSLFFAYDYLSEKSRFFIDTGEFIRFKANTRESLLETANVTHLPPSFIFAALMHEGYLRLYFPLNKDATIGWTLNTIPDQSEIHTLPSKYELDSYYAIGMDTFSNRLKRFKTKKYFPASFKEGINYIVHSKDTKAFSKNEAGTSFKHVSFMTYQDMIIGFGALLKDHYDDAKSETLKYGILPSEDDMVLLTYLYFNSRSPEKVLKHGMGWIRKQIENPKGLLFRNMRMVYDTYKYYEQLGAFKQDSQIASAKAR